MRLAILAALLASPAILAQPAQDTVTDPAPGVPVTPLYQAPAAPEGAAPLYTNGSLASQPTGGGPAGTDPVSVLTTPDTTLGFNCTNGSFRLADDFTVPAGGWSINRIDVFGYQTQAAPGGNTTSPFTTATLRIWNGPPNAAGTIVFGDTTTNRQTSTAWSGVWRVSSTTLTNLQRPVMRITMSGLGLNLAAGTYWIDFAVATAGGASANVFCPPNTAVSASNNALQFNVSTSAWAAALMGGSNRPIDFPFEIYGGTPPVFGYAPAPGSTVTATGGTTIGSVGTLTITPSIATPGSGTGAPATTTLTCTAPTAPFAGFGQTVTAVGSGAISGGPLSGTCTLGAAAVTQTLTCNENRGGTSNARTWTLNCPAGASPLQPVNTMSPWGLVVLILALLGLAAVTVRRPH